MYASAVLGVVILSVYLSVRLSHACFLTNPKNRPAIFFIPHERAILLVKCDFSYSCAAADKISTDLRARAVSLRQLSYLSFLLLLDRITVYYVRRCGLLLPTK